MSPVKPDLEVPPAASPVAPKKRNRPSPDSFSAPTSPKTRELRARYEALHPTESETPRSDGETGSP